MPRQAAFSERSQDKPVFLSKDVAEERVFYRAHPAAHEGIIVVCGGREHCTAGYVIDRRNFPYLCLEWVASGRGSLYLKGRRHPLGPGSFFVYGPGIPHRILTDPRDRMVKYFMDFKGPAAAGLLRRYGLAPPHFRTLPPGSGVLELFDRLIEAGNRQGGSSNRLCRLLLECLIVLATDTRPVPAGKEGQSYASYLRCRSFMEQHSRSIQGMAEVARHCHLDPAYLSRIFRRFSGESPLRFLNRLKMNAAALQLIRRNALVKEIAAECGYADPYHFSKAFKKVHGLSPLAYARAHQA
jgi:AraC-like DNA-binding protein